MLVALGQLLGCWVHGDPWEYWLNMESPGLHHGESMKESQNPIFFFTISPVVLMGASALSSSSWHCPA